ncbi:membrane-bound lytic murein transglycosylase MltF [Myxococcota bacterium]|nr:membrane-bound lytic murein transglycosylase MltF [Myxococcota bacterium]
MGRGLLGLVFCCSVFLQACSGDSATDTSVVELPPPLTTLQKIKERGELVFVTRSNAASYFVWRGIRMGFDYDLAKLFAEHLGVKLRIVVPERWNELLDTLEKGEADLAGAALTPTESRLEQVDFAKPYSLTHMRVVWSRGTKPLDGPEDLAGKEVHIRRHSAYYGQLQKLSADFQKLGAEPIKIMEVEESAETDAILEGVAKGLYKYTLADYGIALINKGYLPRLRIGPVVSAPKSLAWAVPKGADELRREVDKFFLAQKENGRFKRLYSRYYETARTSARRRHDKFFAREGGRLTPWDGLLRSKCEKAGFDWRLIAAQMYQESRFDPKVSSWAGAMGLMQLMPATAVELGVTNPLDPVQSISGGVHYMEKMRRILRDVPDEDERLKLALASYNCGMGHLEDARIMARDAGTDPNLWSDVKQTLALLALPQWANRAKYGYVRASEPIAYVDSIWDRYRAYKHAMGDRDGTPAE